MIKIELPYPPSVNHYKVVGRLAKTKTGKLYQARVNSDETKRYYFEVWMRIRQKMLREGLKSFGGATISLEVEVYPPDRRKRDLDGILKVLCDSLQKGGLFDDDYQIARLVVERRDIIDSGKIIVTVKPLGETA